MCIQLYDTKLPYLTLSIHFKEFCHASPKKEKKECSSFWLSVSLVTAREYQGSQLTYCIIKPPQIDCLDSFIHWTSAQRTLSSMFIYWWLHCLLIILGQKFWGFKTRYNLFWCMLVFVDFGLNLDFIIYADFIYLFIYFLSFHSRLPL